MRLMTVFGPLLVVTGGLVAAVGKIWDRAYNTTYTFSVAQVLNGEPAGFLTFGPKDKRMVVTGFALRRKAERIKEWTRTREGRETVADRLYFPLCVPEDNAAILVSLPESLFDYNATLSETAANRMLTFDGVIRSIPPTKAGVALAQMFEDVRFPHEYCLFVGEEGGWQTPERLFFFGIALGVAGAGLLALRVVRSRLRAIPVEVRAATGAPETGAPSPATDRMDFPEASGPGPESPEEPGQAEAEAPLDAADALAAMVAAVSGQAPAEDREEPQKKPPDPPPAAEPHEIPTSGQTDEPSTDTTEREGRSD